jgi:hypothetical protein
MKKNKQLDTLIADIYEKVEILGRGEAIDVSEEDLDKFAEFMKQALIDWITPRANKKPTLRMSNVGKPSRQLWFDMNSDTRT